MSFCITHFNYYQFTQSKCRFHSSVAHTFVNVWVHLCQAEFFLHDGQASLNSMNIEPIRDCRGKGGRRKKGGIEKACCFQTTNMTQFSSPRSPSNARESSRRRRSNSMFYDYSNLLWQRRRSHKLLPHAARSTSLITYSRHFHIKTDFLHNLKSLLI